MKTNHPLPVAPESRSSKTTIFFTALALAALMVSAIGGGAAFMIYHEFSAMPETAQTPAAAKPQTARLAKAASAPTADRWENTVSMTRPVAAESSDRSDYQYADNTVLPRAAARRVIAAWRSNPVYVPSVPAPLVKTPGGDDVASSKRPLLTDPESRYIVDENTGNVVGVDGSASAVAEARRQQAVPMVVAVQMPPPEIRVASPVQVRAAIPVNPDDVVTDGTQYIPTRPAQPVATGRSFDAASYLASDDNRPVLRAQAVNTAPRTGAYRIGF